MNHIGTVTLESGRLILRRFYIEDADGFKADRTIMLYQGIIRNDTLLCALAASYQ